MKRMAWFMLFAGALMFGMAATAQFAPRISRPALARLENALDAALAGGEHPCELFANTSGLYVDGFGAVFTSTVAITPTRAPNPFQLFTAKDITDIHERKLAAAPFLREKMRDMLFTMAASPSLEGVRPTEQVVCSVTLFYYKWEEQTGLPHQIVMRGEKQELLDVQAGRIPRTQLATLVKTEEL